MPLFVANDNNLALKRVRSRLDNVELTDAEIEIVMAKWTPDRDLNTMVANATVASPIVVTTQAPHGLTTGEEVLLTRVRGVLSANGRHIVTVLSETTFSLDGSDGSGDTDGYQGGGKWWRTLVGVDTLHMTYFPSVRTYAAELDQSAPLIPGEVYLVFFRATNYDFQTESRQQARVRTT